MFGVKLLFNVSIRVGHVRYIVCVWDVSTGVGHNIVRYIV